MMLLNVNKNRKYWCALTNQNSTLAFGIMIENHCGLSALKISVFMVSM